MTLSKDHLGVDYLFDVQFKIINHHKISNVGSLLVNFFFRLGFCGEPKILN